MVKRRQTIYEEFRTPSALLKEMDYWFRHAHGSVLFENVYRTADDNTLLYELTDGKKYTITVKEGIEAVMREPAEPLFTGTVQVRRSLSGMEELDCIQVKPTGATAFDCIDLDEQVDVYRHGARPAPRAITVADVLACDEVATLDTRNLTFPERFADALNARLAGNNPEGE